MSIKLEDSNGCKKDYLEIRDGGDKNSKLLGVYCGSNSPRKFVSNGNQLYMKFVSDMTVSSTGFMASYECTIINKYIISE